MTPEKIASRGMFAGFGLLAVIGYLSILSIDRLMMTVEERRQVSMARQSSTHILLAALNAQRAERGFVITGDEAFVQAFDKHLRAIDEYLGELRAFAESSPEGHTALTELESALDALRGEMNAVIDLRGRRDLDAAAAKVAGGEGNTLMDRVITQSNSLVELILERQEQKHRAVEAGARTARRVIFAGVVTGLLVTVAGLWSVWRSTAARAVAEQATREARHHLEIRVVERTAELAEAVRGLQAEAEAHRATQGDLRTLNAELERIVAERTATLRSMNQELEAFSYSVSHDLRAPLRHIAGFVDLLAKNPGSTFDEKGQRHMTVIRDAATRMGRLIDDLLAFSRTGRSEIRKSAVDLGALTADLVRMLGAEAETEGRSVEWRIGPLPAILADESMLRLAMFNLIANALKYTRPRERAYIEVNALSDGPEEVVVYVKDNGVGFDPRYADKLFGVFQRLHSAEQFEGTGIGLANVRRIIDRHGGKTWAESETDQGATFYFSIRRAPAPAMPKNERPIAPQEVTAA